MHGSVFWECRHSEGRTGTSGDENNCFYWFNADVQPDYRRGLTFKNNIYEDSIPHPNQSFGFRTICSYWCEKVLLEGNIAKNWYSQRLHLIKGPHNDVCIRAENLYDSAMIPFADSQLYKQIWLCLGHDGAADQSVPSLRYEVSWTWALTIAIGDGGSSNFDLLHGPVHMYRCTESRGGTFLGNGEGIAPTLKTRSHLAGELERKDIHHFRRNLFDSRNGFLHCIETFPPGGPPNARPKNDEEARIAWPHCTFFENVCSYTDYGNLLDDDGNIKPAYAYLRGTHGPGIAR